MSEKYEDLTKRLNAYSAEHENHGGITAEAADAIKELDAKVIEWQEEACHWNNEYYYLLDSMPRWIPVAECLPDPYEDVLLKFPNNQAVGFIDRDGCWSVYSGDGFYTEVAENESKPTHWTKKLPEPSEEES